MLKQEPRVYERNDEPIIKCKGCGEDIWFFPLPTGKMMPVTSKTGHSHFAECPNANDFRARKTGPKQGREVRFKR